MNANLKTRLIGGVIKDSIRRRMCSDLCYNNWYQSEGELRENKIRI